MFGMKAVHVMQNTFGFTQSQQHSLCGDKQRETWKYKNIHTHTTRPQDEAHKDRRDKFLFTSPHHHKHAESECEMDIYICHFASCIVYFSCRFFPHFISCVVFSTVCISCDSKNHLTNSKYGTMAG